MAIYPNERWPSDAAVEALDGTTDVATGLPYIAKGVGPASTPTYEVQYNRREQRLLRAIAPINQGRVVDEGGLQIGVYPIAFTIAGQCRSFEGASGCSVPDDATTYVWLDSTPALRTGAAFPDDPVSYLPLARVEAVGGALMITDERPRAIFHVAGRRVVEDFPVNDALTAAEGGKVCTNRGAGGDIELTLPAASAGLDYVFCVVEDAKYVKVVASAGNTIRIGGSVSAAGGYVRASAAGSTLVLAGLNASEWFAMGREGTWSIDS